MSIYRFISAEKARTPVSMCCRLLEVSRSGYYDWARRVTATIAASRVRATRSDIETMTIINDQIT